MKLAMIGISFQKTPIEIREKLAFTLTQSIDAMGVLLEKQIVEIMILSTCNRTEFYIATTAWQKEQNILKQFISGYAEYDLSEYLYLLDGKEAILHLYQVASGLDSIVLGEDQILGQLKTAYQSGLQIGAVKKFLGKIIRESITFAKRIKSDLGISENSLSLGSLSVKFIKEKLYTLKDKKILLIGTGEMGALVLQYLAQEEIGQLYISNRTHGRSHEAVSKYHVGVGVAYEERYEYLGQVDVLITATASPHTIIEPANLKLNKPLLILDLAVPRDVSMEVDKNHLVSRYTVDDLKELAKQNLNYREQMRDQINQEIETAVTVLEDWIYKSKVDPMIATIVAFQDKFIQETLELIEEDPVLSENTEAIYTLMAIAKKRMMRKPIQALKNIEKNEPLQNYEQVIDTLFDYNRKIHE